jgi:hypothetical protein
MDKVITEKTRNQRRGKSMIIKDLPVSIHRKVLKHQHAMTGRPTIDEAAVDLIIRGIHSIESLSKETTTPTL